MGLHITNWILCLVRLTALFSMGTAWMLLLIAFPAKFRVHAQALYNFLEDSSKVDQFTIVTRYTPWSVLFTAVQHCRDQDHKIALAAVKHEFWMLVQIMIYSKKHLYFVLLYPWYHSLIPNTVICSNGTNIGQLQKLHRLCYSSIVNEKVSLKNLVTTTVGSTSLVHLEICIIFHEKWKPKTFHILTQTFKWIVP